MSRTRVRQSKAKKQLKINKEILKITYVFAALFFSMAAYFVYFQVTQAPKVVNNTYNARQKNLEKEIIRGEIQSADGETLAYTEVGADGNETRVYPFDNLFCHVVGNTSYGKSGLELAFNYQMLTTNSDPLNKVVNNLQGNKSKGDNITTTLDTDLQKAAYDALGDYRGAVVCLEPSTGKMLASVSKPDFDPNQAKELWDTINSEQGNQEGLLVNRATQGKYTPGSVFKIFTALEYMRTNKDYNSFSFQCNGSVNFNTSDQYTISCYGNEAHGYENLESAFANSCNCAFSTIGKEFDAKKFASFGKEMLFGTKLPISIESSKSYFGVTKESGLFDKTQTAIGQGKTTVSPLHMAMVASAICNDGVLMKPYLVTSIDSADEKRVKTYHPTKYKDLMSKKESDELKKCMEAVVDYGTAQVLNTDAYEAAGKTGTAELDKNNNVNSWFVGYITKGDRQYAICVVLEKIQEGSGVAAGVVRNMFDNYFTSIGE